jgi:hypothetical protein
MGPIVAQNNLDAKVLSLIKNFQHFILVVSFVAWGHGNGYA